MKKLGYHIGSAEEVDQVLNNCRNFFGPLSPEIKRRIKSYLKKPTERKWDRISSIIINPDGQVWTIWRAVIYLDPTFPKIGRITDINGRIIEKWKRIPTAQEVLEAIKLVTKESGSV